MDFGDVKGFEWDEFNAAKVQRRMDLSIAELAFQGKPLTATDKFHSAKEDRRLLINRVFDKYVFLVFTVRGNRVRIISARYMHRREVRKYEKYFENEKEEA